MSRSRGRSSDGRHGVGVRRTADKDKREQATRHPVPNPEPCLLLLKERRKEREEGQRMASREWRRWDEMSDGC
jgi:hypothetical protein